MKRVNKKNLLVEITPCLIILLLLICGVLNRIESKKTRDKKEPQVAPETNQTPTNTEVTPIQPVNFKVEDNTEIPILMYHHIRDYVNPSDKIGTNLSVSLASFSEELDLIKSKGYNTLTFEDLSNGNIPSHPIILTFDDGYENFYKNAFPELQKRNMKAVSFVIVNSIGNSDYMNKEELIDLESHGIEIGSHTLSHPDLTKITASKAKNEIENSKQTLENILNKKIISFCYPSGKYNSDVEMMVKEAGYKYATTTTSGVGKFISPFDLHRYRVNKDTSINYFIK